MKIENFGEVVVRGDGRIEIKGWGVSGGSGDRLKRFAIRRALWALFKAWMAL